MIELTVKKVKDVLFGPSKKELLITNLEVQLTAQTVKLGKYEALERFAGNEQFSDWDGSKFPGGYDDATILNLDYWQLRLKSAELFYTNLYARGFIRRLITNEINTGLSLEAIPDEMTLGKEPDSLADWSENVEHRFELWGELKTVCDWKGESTFSKLQAEVRREALIEGDILVLIRMKKKTKMPAVHLISGNKVMTPFESTDLESIEDGHSIVYGVETDTEGQQVAYWIQQDDGSIKRLAAFGEQSNRRIAWLHYGTDKRKDTVRGEPILSIILQSLKEIDRYRDATLRKAVINSILAMFIEKGENKMATLPVTNSAVLKETVQLDGNTTTKPRVFNMAAQLPGVIFEELQHGEKPHGFKNDAIDNNFGIFESAILRGIAWANEMPPEILELSFTNNYSASQAAINEFKIYLNKARFFFGIDFCEPFYVEWLIAETLQRKITADGFLAAWRDISKYEIYGSWIKADWTGAIKPSTDILKQAKGYELLIKMGMITRARAARELTGTKYSHNVRQLSRENKQLVDSDRPRAEFNKEFEVVETETLEASAVNQIEASDDDKDSSIDLQIDAGEKFLINGKTYKIDADEDVCHYE